VNGDRPPAGYEALVQEGHAKTAQRLVVGQFGEPRRDELTGG
jgi:hypothetical protein